MRSQGPISTGLLNYLEAHRHDYDAFIFFGYLYATTYFGLPLVAASAFLAPLGHDEWPIHFGMWDRIFGLPRQIIFNTPAERQFLRRRFPAHDLRGPTVGVGIEPPPQVRPGSFRARYQLTRPFLLYLGRIDESKGCREMLDYFITARDADSIDYDLVLAGNEIMPVPFHDHVLSLGFLDNQQKWDALAACQCLWVPSPYESLSMSLLEGWCLARPALVNGKCEVLRAHCETSHGGLWYEDDVEWLAALNTFTPEVRLQLGRNGREYVQHNYSWSRVEQQYLDLLRS
jgi:glycosyltransferase involved in cell wall biosynthesis